FGCFTAAKRAAVDAYIINIARKKLSGVIVHIKTTNYNVPACICHSNTRASWRAGYPIYINRDIAAVINSKYMVPGFGRKRVRSLCIFFTISPIANIQPEVIVVCNQYIFLIIVAIPFADYGLRSG